MGVPPVAVIGEEVACCRAAPEDLGRSEGEKR